MPRPREAKPTAHLGASSKKSDHGRVTTLANVQDVLAAPSIRRDDSDYLDPHGHAVELIRLCQDSEGEGVSGCLAAGQTP